jgi:hypothetical protein
MTEKKLFDDLSVKNLFLPDIERELTEAANKTIEDAKKAFEVRADSILKSAILKVLESVSIARQRDPASNDVQFIITIPELHLHENKKI